MRRPVRTARVVCGSQPNASDNSAIVAPSIARSIWTACASFVPRPRNSRALDRLSPQIIRERLDYWTLIVGPKFSAKERKAINLSRFYAITQIEYCRNFIFKRNFPIHKLFERSCELALWRLTADKMATIFGPACPAATAASLPA